MILTFLSAKRRQTSKSKISNKYLKAFPRNNTLTSVALAVALSVLYISCIARKSDFCICENKGADQLCGDRASDQRLCFHYTDSTTHILLTKISSL